MSEKDKVLNRSETACVAGGACQKFCTNCGAPANGNFCGNCGTELKASFGGKNKKKYDSDDCDQVPDFGRSGRANKKSKYCEDVDYYS